MPKVCSTIGSCSTNEGYVARIYAKDSYRPRLGASCGSLIAPVQHHFDGEAGLKMQFDIANVPVGNLGWDGAGGQDIEIVRFIAPGVLFGLQQPVARPHCRKFETSILICSDAHAFGLRSLQIEK